MATVDSGNETLFSDDSPCDLRNSPHTCFREDSGISQAEVNSRPPNIQPYSGVLEKGKIVIRPIAFKPTGMSPAARFDLNGERYGSTPILTRAGSTNDHRHYIGPSLNYSLDRKLRSSCQSTSPPMGMSSLTSLPHKLMNYDSLESVRKSPVSTVESTITNKSSYRLSGAGGGSLLDLTPSPSDSGVSELEAALRDRDSELAYLRQTMEHNEQVIFRVYQEKERVWERELRRMKNIHENRLRASAQRALKLEQMLMMQTYQLQQDKKRLCGEAQRANCESERLRQEVNLIRGRLEETEWGLCQKTGEISLLKSQLKDYQIDQTAKGHELLQLRNDFREIREELNTRDTEISDLKNLASNKDTEINALKDEIKKLQLLIPVTNSGDSELSRNSDNFSLVMHYKPENREYRTVFSEVSLNACENDENENQGFLKKQSPTYSKMVMAHKCSEAERLKEELEIKRKAFENERLIWAQEKEKVLKYQRQLQINYVQMYRRSKTLESQIENLTVELELDKTGEKNALPLTEFTQTIEL